MAPQEQAAFIAAVSIFPPGSGAAERSGLGRHLASKIRTERQTTALN